jgi:hypothetical protein
MDVINMLKAAAVCFPLVCAGPHGWAQDKPLPYSGDIDDPFNDPALPRLSAPALDSPQAFSLDKPFIYKPITPCRVADTRFSDPQVVTAFGGAGLTTGVTRGFWGWAGDDCADEGGDCYAAFGGSSTTCFVPSLAGAIHVNITVVDPKGSGYLRVWPNNAPGGEPNATVFAWRKGFGMTNALTLPICSDATESEKVNINDVLYASCLAVPGNTSSGIVDFWVKIYSKFAENILIDVLGYYEPLEEWTTVNP